MTLVSHLKRSLGAAEPAPFVIQYVIIPILVLQLYRRSRGSCLKS